MEKNTCKEAYNKMNALSRGVYESLLKLINILAK